MRKYFKYFNFFCFTAVSLFASQASGIDFFLVNASTGTSIGQVENDDTIYLKQVGRALNIRAEVTENVGYDKVSFVLDGAVVRTDHAEPYALAGDDDEGSDFSWTLSAGAHKLSAIALDASNNTVAQSTITFSVSTASIPDIVLTLVNPDTDTDLYELNDLDTILLATSSALNISADVSVANHDRVRFVLDGNVVRTDPEEPYALAGDDGHGDYYAWSPGAGSHTLRVVAYNADGTAIAERTIKLTVSRSISN